jgi:hypothetical protein
MVLVDANVLLDVLTDDPDWRAWSEDQLLTAVETDDLAINPIIYAELAPAYRTAAQLERALRGWTLRRLALPYEAPAFSPDRPLCVTAVRAESAAHLCLISTLALTLRPCNCGF